MTTRPGSEPVRCQSSHQPIIVLHTGSFSCELSQVRFPDLTVISLSAIPFAPALADHSTVDRLIRSRSSSSSRPAPGQVVGRTEAALSTAVVCEPERGVEHRPRLAVHDSDVSGC